MSSKKISTTVGLSEEVYRLLAKCKELENRSLAFIVERALKKDLGLRKDLQEDHADKK